MSETINQAENAVFSQGETLKAMGFPQVEQFSKSNVAPIQGLTEGKIVHYVLPDGRSEGEVRPAIVVRVWRDVSTDLIERGYSNLVVFIDGTNDYPNTVGHTIWAPSRVYSDNKEPGTWHWPIKVLSAE